MLLQQGGSRSLRGGSRLAAALEGHVPVREIRRLLRDKPAGGVGIAVPGLPLGSPGMDLPAYGGRKMPYDVLLVRRDGSTSVYQCYR